MHQKVIFHPLARQELLEAVRFYEDLSPGLGRRLRMEAKAFLDKILAHLLRYSVRIAPVRRANLDRFPYHLNYFLHGSDIAIVAVSHHRQRPFYWRGRLTENAWLGQ